MISFQHAMKSDRSMKAVTGLTVFEFNQLLIRFEQAYEQQRRLAYSQNPKQRAFGGGRRPVLASPAERLFFILIYYKGYPTFDLAGVLFGIARTSACDWAHLLSPILTIALGQELVLPLRKLHSLSEFLTAFPDAQAIMIDGTERPRRRPQDPDDQRHNYSGKKKRHTIKNLIISDKQKHIGLLTPSYHGKQHDYAICKLEGLATHIPKWVEVYVDSGFEGFDKDNPLLKIMKPKRKPRGKELYPEDKGRNRSLSSTRVLVEHAIGGVKRLGVVAQVYRNLKEGFDDEVMLNSCGLWNFHLKLAQS